jgi:hypothetical protein
MASEIASPTEGRGDPGAGGRADAGGVRRQGRGRAEESIGLRGTGHAARVVTSAALIMFTIFVSLMFAKDTTVKAIGFGFAIGTFLDGTRSGTTHAGSRSTFRIPVEGHRLETWPGPGKPRKPRPAWSARSGSQDRGGWGTAMRPSPPGQHMYHHHSSFWNVSGRDNLAVPSRRSLQPTRGPDRARRGGKR